MKRRLTAANASDCTTRSSADISKKPTTTTTPQTTTTMQSDFHNVQEEKVAAKEQEQDSSKTATATTTNKNNNKKTTMDKEQDDDDDDMVYSDDDEYSYHSSSSASCSQDSPENAISLAVSNKGYCFCDLSQVQSIMDTTIQEMADLLCIPPQAAIVLLRHYKWNTKLLTDDYFGSSKQEEIQQTCGVYHRCQPSETATNTTTTTTRDDSTKTTCAICFDSVHTNDVFGMSCGHDDFCKECWMHYLQEALSRGPACVYTTCPNASCQEVVTQVEIHELAPSLEPKFHQFQLKSFVESNPMMQWCPGASCDSVAVGSSLQGWMGDGSCPECNTCFCLKCGHVQHSPCTCHMLEIWNHKCTNDSETANWMLCKTKKCPKCDARINKNGGCNHMKCSQCQFHFCWLCMVRLYCIYHVFVVYIMMYIINIFTHMLYYIHSFIHHLARLEGAWIRTKLQ